MCILLPYKPYFFLNHNNSTETADRFRLPLNPLQISPQYLQLKQEAHKSLYRSPGPCFLDCPVDPYFILCSPLVAILDRTLTCRILIHDYTILKGDNPRTSVTKFDSSWLGGFRGEDL